MSVLIAVLIPDVLLIVAMLVFSATTKIGRARVQATRRAAAPKIFGTRLESLGAFRHAERQIVY